MGEVDRTRIKAALMQHYASRREATSTEAVDKLVAAMVFEDAGVRKARSHRTGVAEFVASQVRYIPTWTWVAQTALVALMCTLAYVVGDAESTKVSVGILSAMCVLAGVPTVQASKLHRVAELEYACLYDATSVMVARLIALGCSSALSVALMVGTTAPAVEASSFEVALWACPPFFLSCAGSLMALRKAHPTTAATLCVAWTAACSVALLALASVLPDLYANTSLAAWALAATAAAAWLAREAVLTLQTASAGLDAFSPRFARTHE